MTPDIRLTIDTGGALPLSVTDGASVSLEIETSQGSAPYTGDYDITPTRQAQTLETAGRTLGADIIIEPIPNNYGLITWDGSTLTVS